MTFTQFDTIHRDEAKDYADLLEGAASRFATPPLTWHT